MNESLALLIWVALGSALGGVARFFVSGLVARRIGEVFPWGTLAVNASGSFAIGVLAALTERHLLPAPLLSWQFAVTGFLGSYTTVSSFSLQTLALARDGEFRQAAGNVVLSLILCIGGAAAGFAIAAAR